MFQANPKRYDLLGAVRSGFDDSMTTVHQSLGEGFKTTLREA